jgi:trimeric autotransporter adhesin
MTLVGLLASAVLAQSVDGRLWGAGGVVNAFAQSGSTLYIGGSFSHVGPCSGGGVPVDGRSGLPWASYPKVNGYVFSSMPDGHGGWFIAGEFTVVGGQSRVNAAHILADGRVTEWAPNPDFGAGDRSSRVWALARTGDTVYVAGDFDLAGGETRLGLAAVNATTGAALSWDAAPSAYGMNALALKGDTLLVAGNFDHIGGLARNYLAAVSRSTGLAFGWDPRPDYNVRTLRVCGQTLYVGGQFWTMSGLARDGLAAFDLTSGAMTEWDPKLTRPARFDSWDDLIADVVVHEGTVYLAGAFAAVGGKPRAGLAAVDSITGETTDWNPNPAGASPYPRVETLALSGDTLLIGGYFSTVGSSVRICLAALDLPSGVARDWDPRPDNAVWTLCADGTTTYVGGSFISIRDWVVRHGLAALDLTTGRVKDWAPEPDGYIVRSLCLAGDKLYAAGDFKRIGGATRWCIAALDTASGLATDWDAQANAPVRSLAMLTGALYVGGDFTSIGGQPLRYLAALDTASGLALDWDPQSDYLVTKLATGGNTIYVAGWFSSMGDKRREMLAAVDATTGAVTDWAPEQDNWIDDLIAVDGKVFLCGTFGVMNGIPRNGLAAVDDSVGALTDWDPAPYGRTWSLATDGREIYAGGEFLSIGGQPRLRIAALDPSTGLATDWDPGGANSTVMALSVAGQTLYAGGLFGSMGGLPTTYMAAISLPELPVEPTYSFTLSQSIPNPSAGQALIRYTLPAAATVTLAAYDVQGRRLATWLDHEPQSAGTHEVAVRASTWRPGMYLYRLEAGGRNATRKMIVVK